MSKTNSGSNNSRLNNSELNCSELNSSELNEMHRNNTLRTDIQYHPDIDLLLKYSTGQLEPGLAIAIGIHHQECESCRQKVQDIESIGGSTLESLSDENTPMDGFEMLLNDIDTMPQIESSSDYEICAVAERDLSMVEQLGQRRFDGIQWQKMSKNISRAQIEIDDFKYKMELFKFQPDAKIPKHTHLGNEYTLVLQGDFSDKAGQYKCGEFIAQNQSNEHQPVAGKEGCICLAITDAPLKFTGAFGPVLNWLTR